jgi:hypothetical protein
MMSDFTLEAKLPKDIELVEIIPEKVTVETAPANLMIFPPGPIN